MFTTAVRVERDLGVPSVSFNTLTGHRSCTPEDCSELVANSPQGPVPVSGVFPVGSVLHLLETRLRQYGFHHVARIPRHATPYAWAWTAGFLACCCPRLPFQGPGQPSDPETSPLVSARCAGDTPVRFTAHRLLRPLRRHRTRVP